jgi:hypothetical protein
VWLVSWGVRSSVKGLLGTSAMKVPQASYDCTAPGRRHCRDISCPRCLLQATSARVGRLRLYVLFCQHSSPIPPSLNLQLQRLERRTRFRISGNHHHEPITNLLSPRRATPADSTRTPLGDPKPITPATLPSPTSSSPWLRNRCVHP